MTTTRLAIISAILAIAGLGGCRYGPASGLPEHIQTVRIPTFRNNTFYVGMEGPLTREIIERMVRDPRLEVVQSGEDSRLTGEIIEVQKRVLRQTSKDEPASVRLTIVCEVTFEDRVEGVKILDQLRIHSSTASSEAGVYDLERGQSRSEAESDAIEELAAEIVRRTAGMW